MNLLAFNSIKQYKDMLNDTSFVKCKLKKWPTIANKTMLKHAYNTWQPDARFVILLNQYKSNIYSDNLLKFNGERLVIIDSGDKGIFWPPYIDMCTGTNNIYIKDNSYSEKEVRTNSTYKAWRKPDWPKAKNITNANIRIGCYSPSVKVIHLIKKHDIKWRNERTHEAMFCGDMHANRRTSLEVWKIFKKTNNCIFGNEKTFERLRYIKEMAKTKLAPSFIGKGLRCRREWEALLCGALLVNDPKLKKYPFVLMEPEKFFTFKMEWDEEIADRGFMLARRSWMNAPSIDIRMAALYLFFGAKQLWDYQDIMEKEYLYGLRKGVSIWA